ncbi:hypothetical protein RUM43_000193 [Polyplax serrata]|uniref:Uncharacterized protein n=1 Tax=Polyplax serrata TaxID=468196 RepID=A0AAN8XMR0_POLSC
MVGSSYKYLEREREREREKEGESYMGDNREKGKKLLKVGGATESESTAEKQVRFNFGFQLGNDNFREVSPVAVVQERLEPSRKIFQTSLRFDHRLFSFPIGGDRFIFLWIRNRLE